MTAEVNEILSPEMQDSFWGLISPDMRHELKAYEKLEQWTYNFEEIPEMFVEISKALPKVVEMPLTVETQELLKPLIPLLSALPLGPFMSCLIWLDNRASHEPEAYGWGVICYREAVAIVASGEQTPMYEQARIVYERVQFFMQSVIVMNLFNKLKEEMY